MSDRPSRHLAAVVFTDLVGYTALMQEDEAAALSARELHRSALQKVVPRHSGRLLQFLGDGSLSLFPSSVFAVSASLALQELFQDGGLPVRIGIDEGEVAYDDQGVYGHCVNVASRVEGLARPGTVFVSEKVFREVENQPAFVGAFEGEYDLKNVDRPVRVFSLRAAPHRTQTAELHLLGGVSLRLGGSPVAGRSAQRRRMAFLALLSAAPHGVMSRDKIVGFLWPDTDPPKARRLLSEALYVVRKSLGEQSIVATGEELSLNPDVVWSDVVSYREAIDAGELETAVELYAGPFLDGFYVDDAVEFDHWSDAMRDRLAREHAGALRQLAEAAEARGVHGEAVRWWRQLIGLDPFDAAVSIRYMEALESAGRRAEALQFAQRHAGLLREEFGAEPNPEVEALASRLRDTPARIDLSKKSEPPATPRQAFDSVAVFTPTIATTRVVTPLATPQSPTSSRTRSPRWRQVGLPTVASAVVALAVWVAIGLLRDGSGPPALAAPQPATVAVIPFDDDPDNIFARLLSVHLADLRGITSVPSVNLMGKLPPLPGAVPYDSLGVIVSSLNGTHLVRGSVVALDDAVVITVNLSTPENDSIVFQWAGQGGSSDQRALVRTAAVELIAYLSPSGIQPQIGPIGSESDDAVFAYLEGGLAFLDTDFQAAIALYERAINADPEFAMAYYRLSQALEWDEQYVEALTRAHEAHERINSLGTHDRLLVEGWWQFLDGDARAALATYEAVNRRWTDDLEALYGLAKVQMIYNPYLGRSRHDAQVSLDRLQAAAPSFSDGLLASMELAALRGDSERFDSLQALVSPNSTIARTWDLSEGLAEGDRNVAQTMANISDPVTLGFVSGQLAGYWRQPDAASELVHRFLTSPRARADQETATVAMLLGGVLQVTQGRWDLGSAELMGAVDSSPGWATELMALYACLEGQPESAAAEARAALERWLPDEERDESLNEWLALHNNQHDVIRIYLMGLTEIHGGSAEAADDDIEALDNIRPTQDGGELAEALALSLKAHQAYERGEREAALFHLDLIDLSPTLPQLIASPFFSRPHDRFLRARILEDNGIFQADPAEDAIGWYTGLTEMWDFAYIAPAHLGLARSYAALGDTALAVEHYRKAEVFWHSGDPAATDQLAQIRVELGIPDSTVVGEGSDDLEP